MASSSRDPNRQRNVYLMIGAVVVVIIWLLWTAISPGGSSTPSPTTGTTPEVMPMLITACQKTIAVHPTASTAPKRSFASEATRIPHTVRKQ